MTLDRRMGRVSGDGLFSLPPSTASRGVGFSFWSGVASVAVVGYNPLEGLARRVHRTLPSVLASAVGLEGTPAPECRLTACRNPGTGEIDTFCDFAYTWLIARCPCHRSRASRFSPCWPTLFPRYPKFCQGGLG